MAITTAELLARCRALTEKGRQPNGEIPMALATSGSDGEPDVRYVLLKDVDASGFVFYTNAKSRKGRQLRENARASLAFYWQPLGVQLRVSGAVEEVSAKTADAYWASRDPESRLASAASDQSEEIPDRAKLLERVEALRKKHGGDVPRPKHWTGFRVVPSRIEWWTAKEHRLHERELYVREKKGDAWRKSLLQP